MLKRVLTIARHPLPLAAGVVVVCLGLLFSWALFWTAVSARALKQGNLAAAAPAARRAAPVTQGLAALTFHLQPDLIIWRNSLLLLGQSDSLLPQLRASLELKPDQPQAQTLATVLEPQWQPLEESLSLIPRSWFIRHLLSPEQNKLVSELTTALPILRDEVLTGRQTWLLVFQNSQELRPSGGFIGSLAFMTLNNGSLEKIEVQDIYQPAGQLKEYIEAPEAVAEFLSGGKGWQMTDANWSPEFAQSAHTLLQMMSAAGYPEMRGVIAVNDEVALTLLELVGPQSLPDYEMTVTPDNMAEVLRSNRSTFFPGSIGKQHLLSSFFTQMKTALMQLTPAEQITLISKLRTQALHKNLQLYATSPTLQALFTHAKISPSLEPSRDPQDLYFALNEANVGINKANQKVSRSVKLDVLPTQTRAEITFTNDNVPADRPLLSPEAVGAEHLHYVAYVRVYLPVTAELTASLFDSSPLTPRQETPLTTVNGHQLKELSYLVVINESTRRTLSLTFSHPALSPGAQVVLQRQSGIQPTPYQIIWQGQTSWVTLDEDYAFRLP